MSSQSFVATDAGTADKYGHGTHVGGIIAGNGQASTGSNYTYTFKGISPNANLINLRVLDQNGAGTDSAVINALNWAVTNKAKYNIRVINLSLGRPVYESYTLDPLCQAVEQAWNAGIVVVVAAGNYGRDNTYNENGYGTITAPGNDPYVITVDENFGDAKPCRRCDRQLQLQRPNPLRPCGEARYRRPRKPHQLPLYSRTDTAHSVLQK